VSIINSLIWCGGAVLVVFMVLLAMPKSMLRCVFLEVAGWLIGLLAAIYVVSPIDIVPDFIPVLGWLDDGGALIGGAGAVITALMARSDRKSLEQK